MRTTERRTSGPYLRKARAICLFYPEDTTTPCKWTHEKVFARAATRGWGTPASVGGEPGGTSGSIHGLGYLFSALRREGLIANELVLQLATFLRSLHLFLELTVRTIPRTLTANQVRRGGK
jgi:hypothetical protein